VKHHKKSSLLFRRSQLTDFSFFLFWNFGLIFERSSTLKSKIKREFS